MAFACPSCTESHKGHRTHMVCWVSILVEYIQKNSSSLLAKYTVFYRTKKSPEQVTKSKVLYSMCFSAQKNRLVRIKNFLLILQLSKLQVSSKAGAWPTKSLLKPASVIDTTGFIENSRLHRKLPVSSKTTGFIDNSRFRSQTLAWRVRTWAHYD